MQAQLAKKAVVIVLFDSVGRMTRIGDAKRIKRWMETVQTANKQPMHTVTAHNTKKQQS